MVKVQNVEIERQQAIVEFEVVCNNKNVLLGDRRDYRVSQTKASKKLVGGCLSTGHIFFLEQFEIFAESSEIVWLDPIAESARQIADLCENVWRGHDRTETLQPRS